LLQAPFTAGEPGAGVGVAPAPVPEVAEGAPNGAAVDGEPIVKVDPELERLLAEEEDIERRTRGEHHETPHFPKDS
jgi:hypothetical protein